MAPMEYSANGANETYTPMIYSPNGKSMVLQRITFQSSDGMVKDKKIQYKKYNINKN